MPSPDNTAPPVAAVGRPGDACSDAPTALVPLPTTTAVTMSASKNELASLRDLLQQMQLKNASDAKNNTALRRPRRSEGGLLHRSVQIVNTKNEALLHARGTATRFLKSGHGTAKARYVVTLEDGRALEVRAALLRDQEAPLGESREIWEHYLDDHRAVQKKIKEYESAEERSRNSERETMLVKKELGALRSSVATLTATLATSKADAHKKDAATAAQLEQYREEKKRLNGRLAELADIAADAEERADAAEARAHALTEDDKIEELAVALREALSQKAALLREVENLRVKSSSSSREYMARMAALKIAEEKYRSELIKLQKLKAENLHLRSEVSKLAARHTEVISLQEDASHQEAMWQQKLANSEIMATERLESARAIADAQIKESAARAEEANQKAALRVRELQESMLKIVAENTELNTAKTTEANAAENLKEEIASAQARAAAFEAQFLDAAEQVELCQAELTTEQLHQETLEDQIVALKAELAENAEQAAHDSEAASASWRREETRLRLKITELRTIVDRVSALVGPITGGATTLVGEASQEPGAPSWNPSVNKQEAERRAVEHQALQEEMQRQRKEEVEDGGRKEEVSSATRGPLRAFKEG